MCHFLISYPFPARNIMRPIAQPYIRIEYKTRALVETQLQIIL